MGNLDVLWNCQKDDMKVRMYSVLRMLVQFMDDRHFLGVKLSIPAHTPCPLVVRSV